MQNLHLPKTIVGQPTANALGQTHQSPQRERTVIRDNHSLPQTEPLPPVRRLKIEVEGDFWKGLTKPKIRLVGRWLERAGFRPGHRVHVVCVAPGFIELRFADASTVEATEPASTDPTH